MNWIKRVKNAKTSIRLIIKSKINNVDDFYKTTLNSIVNLSLSNEKNYCT